MKANLEEEFMEPAKKLTSHKFEIGIDDHLFIMIERPDRPTISLDFMNSHGRNTLGIRVAGMCIASILCDIKELPPKITQITRYCPMCGEKIQLCSSRSHNCKEGVEKDH